MGKAKWVVIAAVCILAGATVDAVGQVIIRSGKPRLPATLKEGIATRSKLEQPAVAKMLRAIGPAVAEQLASGRTVNIPGLGVLRVVRVAQGKDINRNGNPIIVPARNYVEFVISGDLEAIANSPGAVPARTVIPYEFKVDPGRVSGIRTGSSRTPRTRTR